ncbi:MAG: hypothetical protein ABH834_03545 [Candidatus Altiarchaeota archaeon]
MPFLYKLIREERCLSRWMERQITGFNSRHSWNLHRISHMLVNGAIIGSGAAMVLIFLLILGAV